MATKLLASSTASGSLRSLWRNLDYMLLLSGQTISGFGTQASQLAFPLLMLALTHSPVQASIISGLRLVPYIILGLPAGAWVDRVDRKRLMIFCDIMRALALGSIPFAYSIGHLTPIQLHVTSLIEGSLYVFLLMLRHPVCRMLWRKSKCRLHWGKIKLLMPHPGHLVPPLVAC